MTAAYWANADFSAVLLIDGERVRVLRAGAEFEAAVAAGPMPVPGDLSVLLPAPAPQPDPVPAVVSRFQAMAALFDFGLLAEVEASLSGAGVVAQLAWAEAGEFRRDSPTINGMAAGLGLSDAQVDDLFRHAAQIAA